MSNNGQITHPLLQRITITEQKTNNLYIGDQTTDSLSGVNVSKNIFNKISFMYNIVYKIYLLVMLSLLCIFMGFLHNDQCPNLDILVYINIGLAVDNLITEKIFTILFKNFINRNRALEILTTDFCYKLLVLFRIFIFFINFAASMQRFMMLVINFTSIDRCYRDNKPLYILLMIDTVISIFGYFLTIFVPLVLIFVNMICPQRHTYYYYVFIKMIESLLLIICCCNIIDHKLEFYSMPVIIYDNKENDNKENDSKENENENENENDSKENIYTHFYTSCPICLINFDTGNELYILPCKHYFHKQCISDCLQVKQKCPYCRYDINDLQNNV